MSLRRLAGTTAAMAVVAALLAALSADLPGPGVLADPQAFVDTAGPDRLVAGLAAQLAWLAWGWGALGLVLTALSAIPGIVGGLARGVGRLVLPAGVRRAAAVALGVGLVVVTPTLTACSPAAQPAAAVQSLPQSLPVPDWPAGPAPAPAEAPPAAPSPAPVPAWPAGEHVVLPGDCLWDIAAADLRARTGAEPHATEVARAVEAWWAANADVIGPDPDLLLPGQVLRAPVTPAPPPESENPA
ncbi:LysM domain-containing protein [Blastococcus sp. TF02A-26]|uniref:LysM peptidoglycan-binding domain-containing protein n=1 Tax=Blastococcus sp. TF02A-26 TaxID=2250577 RepID=UPI000DE9B7C8|nr:LysM domain-containing protein [Blastococcus sp. TF02A-26]RBY89796.1 hypothetical protein DQ240_02450 [Blastococcus sp. TF02A-26]